MTVTSWPFYVSAQHQLNNQQFWNVSYLMSRHGMAPYCCVFGSCDEIEARRRSKDFLMFTSVAIPALDGSLKLSQRNSKPFGVTIAMLASRQWQNSSVWATKMIKSVMPAHIKEYKKLVLLMIDCCFEPNRSMVMCKNLLLIISVCLHQRITLVREEICCCLHHGECVVLWLETKKFL